MRTRGDRRPWRIAIVTLAVLATGCSSDSQGNSGAAVEPTPLPSTSASLSNSPNSSVGPLSGDWTTDITAADGVGPGRWRLRFRGGSVELINPSGDAGPGATPFFLLPGKRIRFAPDPSCPGQTRVTAGVYSYDFSAEKLTFTEVGHTDSCRDHAKVLTSHPWGR
jgi:hypothetical protein